MAIHSKDKAVVIKSSKDFMTRRRGGASPSAQIATVKSLSEEIQGMQQIGAELWEKLLDVEQERSILEKKITSLEGADNLVEQINSYADLVEQF
jgi:hypothetical protein